MTNLPENKVFMNLQRVAPKSNNYRMTLAIQLRDFRVKEYNPNKMRYDRVNGVKYRSTTMLLQSDPGHSELWMEEYNVNANRSEEDAIAVQLMTEEQPMAKGHEGANTEQAQQRNPDPAPTTNPTGGSSSGSYEP